MHVGVQCVRGIELNTYAAELARVTVWIGEIQWMLRHGVQPSKNPILKPLETIECRDAVLKANGTDPDWPFAHAIIGNPPFLGNKRMLSELGEDYTERLRRLFKGRLPGGVDLVTYWFERARAQLETGKAERAGLVATQAIRKGANRTSLDRIVATAPIFNAWRDEPWVNEGAAVRVSLVAFGNGGGPRLDGKPVAAINPDLTPREGTSANVTQARPLPENERVAYQGPVKVGKFDIPGELARAWLPKPNPHGKPNSDVLRPWANGNDLTGRPSDTWIIDFGGNLSQKEAALYELPFGHVLRNVKPMRDAGRREVRKRYWWRHGETVPAMRQAMAKLRRYIATPRVAKHRFFVFLPVAVLPDSRLYAVCREDDFTFGVLSSRIHAVWALATGSRHGDGDEGGRPTYNARDCFETFPFPSVEGSTREAVASAARNLDQLRDNWLNPREWIDRVPEIATGYPSRIVVKEGHEDDLKTRTMTDLYNALPAWLADAHNTLDEAVARAYGWSDYTAGMPDDVIIARLLKLNLARAQDLFAQTEKTIAVVKGGRSKRSVKISPRRRRRSEAA